MKQYLELVEKILNEGEVCDDRTNTGVIGLFGYQMRFNLNDGFPLLTTKKMFLKGIIYELLWFLRGDTNIKYLIDHNVHIWDEWADEDGEIGPLYGKQWVSWQRSNDVVDQIQRVINSIKYDPNSRRMIVSSWNVGDLDKMALPPCHLLFQFYVNADKLSLQLYQRSGDVFLGIPFNIASYSLLLKMIAQITNLKPHEFIYTIGDVHIYTNHTNQLLTQLKRSPYKLPDIKINQKIQSIYDFKYRDFELVNYKYHSQLKGKIAV